MGGAGGGGFLGGIMGKLLSGGGLGGLISNLFGGGQQSGASGAADQTNQLLGDIKNMLGQLLDQKGGGQGGCGGSGAVAWRERRRLRHALRRWSRLWFEAS